MNGNGSLYKDILHPPPGAREIVDDGMPQISDEEVIASAYAKVFAESSEDARIVLRHLAHECYYNRSWYKDGRGATDVTFCEGRRSVFIGIRKFIKKGRGEA